jgi:hypothetical protein
MKLTTLHPRFVGSWAGDSTLYTPWMEPKEQSCESTVVVAPVAKGKFLSFAYTWSHEGKDHEGLLIVGNANKAEEATGAFIDSWHMSTNVMQFKGSVNEHGVIHLLGSYAAPPGPDWGWRIEIRSEGDTLTLKMFNISPEGAEEIAVLGEYRNA